MLSYTKTRFHAIRMRLENHVPSSRFRGLVWEFLLFGFKQGWACLFGGLMLSLLLITKWCWPQHFWLARYDFLFLAALAIQISMLLLRLETVREAKVILMFHVVGTLMEIFKTSAGSWAYPESSLLRIGHVPLFSGFMYASVGSYLARISRILDVRYTGFPSRTVCTILAALIYANFFTHHFIPDFRLILFGIVALAFGRTWAFYKPYRKYRRMPLLIGFCLVAFFIWAAENIGTFASVWVYPNQRDGWRMVDFSKFGSWLLLMIISYILVSFAHRPQLPPLTELLPEIPAAEPAL